MAGVVLAPSTGSGSSHESDADRCVVCKERCASAVGRCDTCTQAVLCDACTVQLSTRPTCVTCRQPWAVWMGELGNAAAEQAGGRAMAPIIGAGALVAVILSWVWLAMAFHEHPKLRHPFYHAVAIPMAPVLVVAACVAGLTGRQWFITLLGCMLAHVMALLAATVSALVFVGAIMVGLLVNLLCIAAFVSGNRGPVVPFGHV